MPIPEISFEEMLQQLKQGQIAQKLLLVLERKQKEFKISRADLVRAIQAKFETDIPQEGFLMPLAIFERIVSDNLIATFNKDRTVKPSSKKMIPVFAEVLVPTKEQLPEGSPSRSELKEGFVSGFKAKFAALGEREIEYKYTARAGTPIEGVRQTDKFTMGRLPKVINVAVEEAKYCKIIL